MNRNGMPGHGRQGVVLSILVLLLLTLSNAEPWTGCRAAEPPENLPGTLQLAAYQATAFSYHETGTLLWLLGADDILRLEIRRGPQQQVLATVLPALLEQRGEGWTAILTRQGDDTLNAWGQEWHLPPAGMARAARLVSQALVAGPPTVSPDRGGWRAGSAANHPKKFRIPTLGRDSTPVAAGREFRQSHSGRGLGRGGADDVLELAWAASSTAEAPRLRVRVTRRPGHLELVHIGAKKVVYASPEAFVPLWPLAQLVTFAH